MKTFKYFKNSLSTEKKTGRNKRKCALANLKKAPRSGLEPTTYRTEALFLFVYGFLIESNGENERTGRPARFLVS